MNNAGNVMKIVWAVDPFVEDKSQQRAAAWALRSLTKSLKAEIEPVYSLGAYPARVPFESPKDLIEYVQAKAQDEFEEILRRVKLPGLKPITVLANSAGSRRETVDQLVDHAREVGAEMIVASTRARKGPQRWMTGSFAESLMLHSDVPLFLVNPQWEHPTDLKHILFPTDFSDESKEAFSKVVKLAEEIGGRITIHHKISFDLNPGLEIALAAYPPFLPIPPETFDEEVRKKKTEALRWADFARAEGVLADVFVDGRVTGTPADSILRFAKKKAGLIAMAARSGPVAAVLLGSTTRQVVRSSPVPVWIVHTPQKKKAALAKVRGLRLRKRPAPLPFTVTEADIMDDLRYHGRKKRGA